MKEEIEKIIQELGLVPHPEGGYFRETYRSEATVPLHFIDERYKGERYFSTCIYFLLTSASFSAFHRIRQDEIWHFYKGSAVELHQIPPSGEYHKNSIGNNIAVGETPQLVIPGGNWFAAAVPEPDSYALVGCTVSPGFDFQDFVLAKRDVLITDFPEHAEVIRKYTRE